MAYHRAYHAGESSTTIQDAKEELVNDITAQLFFAEGGIEQLVEHIAGKEDIPVKEKKTFLETLKEIINKIVDVIKKYVTDNHLSASEKAVADMSLDDVKKLRAQFLDVIDGAIENLENGVEVGNDTKRSIELTTDNQPVVVVNDSAYRNSNNLKDLVKIVKNNLSRFKKICIGQQNISINKTSRDELSNSEYSKRIRKYAPQKFIDKMDSLMHQQEIVYATVNFVNEEVKHKRTDNIIDFARGNVLLQVNGNQYKADVVFAYTKGGIIELYDIVNIENDSFTIKNKAGHSQDGNNMFLSEGEQLAINSILKNKPNVKKSLDVDTDGNKLTAEQQEHFTDPDVEPAKYSYEYFAKKQDMQITEIDDSQKYNPDSKTRKNIVDTSINNAKKVGTVNENGNAVIHVDDIDEDVIIGKNGVKHGLDRRLNIVAPVILNIGNILKNSIRVNELLPKNENVSENYVLIGAAKGYKNDFYIIESVLDKYNNELQTINVLHSANTKKEAARLNDAEIADNKSTIRTTSTISIPDLLDYVNKYYPDILPEDVLKHYGYDSRPEGKIGESALYSKDIETDDTKSLIKQNKKLQKTVEYYKMMLGRNSGHKVNRKRIKQYAVELTIWSSLFFELTM